MFNLIYEFCVFVVGQLDPVLSIGAFHKLPMSDIRPTDQPMDECSVVCFCGHMDTKAILQSLPKAGYGRHIARNS